MALSTSNLKAGVFGDRKVLEGNWTGSAGDASGSITLPSSHVLGASFLSQDSDSPKEQPSVSISYSGGVATISVHNHMDVTKGSFIIIYA